MGRKTLLTPALQTNFVKAINRGATFKIACGAVGISYACLFKWMKEGTEGKDPAKVEFVEVIEKAKSARAIKLLGMIEDAAEGQQIECENCGEMVTGPGGQWTAAAWLAERCHGLTRTQKVEVEVDAHLQVSAGPDLSRLTDEELGQYRALLEKMEAPKVLEMVPAPEELEDRDGE